MLTNAMNAMAAIGFEVSGTADVLKPVDLPIPSPGPGEVLIKVSYAGVNRGDVFQRKGDYPPPPGSIPILGSEVSGWIAALGAGVTEYLPGQAVCAIVNGGGYAEYCVAKASHCLPVPEGLGMDEAAALPETLFTVWHSVFERGYARDGEKLLVHGGTGGIGTMAILLGKQFGLTVIVTCGSHEKCIRALEIGAAHAINYTATDFVEEVSRITDGKGVHLVLDTMGGDYVPRNLKCLGLDGRHVTIALRPGSTVGVNMAMVMARRYTLTGSTLHGLSDAFKALLAQEILANAWPLFEDGDVRPVIDTCFPLEEASKAHAHLEAGNHVGKIVLKI